MNGIKSLVLFQFLEGAIKGELDKFRQVGYDIFQFLEGAIKGLNLSFPERSTKTFQFLEGAIKGFRCVWIFWI